MSMEGSGEVVTTVLFDNTIGVWGRREDRHTEVGTGGEQTSRRENDRRVPPQHTSTLKFRETCGTEPC